MAADPPAGPRFSKRRRQTRVLVRSERVQASFTGADTDDRIHRADQTLPSPILPVRAADDDVDDLVDGRFVDDDFRPDLRDEVDGILGTAVDLGVPLLPTRIPALR